MTPEHWECELCLKFSFLGLLVSIFDPVFQYDYLDPTLDRAFLSYTVSITRW